MCPPRRARVNLKTYPIKTDGKTLPIKLTRDPPGPLFAPAIPPRPLKLAKPAWTGKAGGGHSRTTKSVGSLSWRSRGEIIFAIGFDDAVVGLREISFQFFMQRGKCMIRHHRKHVMLDMIVHVPIR